MKQTADELHAQAVARNEDGYIDPDSGLFVLTSAYLSRRPCCGNRCRHCPWDYEGVVD